MKEQESLCHVEAKAFIKHMNEDILYLADYAPWPGSDVKRVSQCFLSMIGPILKNFKDL